MTLSLASGHRTNKNAVGIALGRRIDDVDAEVRRICREQCFPLDEILTARRRIMQAPGMEATMTHRDAMKRGLAAVADLPAFLAALEGYSRRVSGGGRSACGCSRTRR